MKHLGFSHMLDSSQEFSGLLNGIRSGLLPAHINGVAESVVSHLVFCVSQQLNQSGLVIAPDGVTARNIFEDLQLFYGDDVALFPERELLFYDIDAVANDITSARLDVLNRLQSQQPVMVVTTIAALLGVTVPQPLFAQLQLVFTPGSTVDLGNLINRFIELGYTREDLVEGKGQFSVRGGIVDFYPPNAQAPYRVELFDNEVDSIREFDAFSQRSLDKAEVAIAIPAGELLLTKQKRLDLMTHLQKQLKTQDDVLRSTVQRDLEKLEQQGHFPALDKYIPFIYEGTPTLMDYITPQTMVFLCEPQRTAEAAESSRWQVEETVANAVEKGLLAHPDAGYTRPYVDAIYQLEQRGFVSMAGLSDLTPEYRPKQLLQLTNKEQVSFHGKIDFFYDAMRFYHKQKYGVVVLGGNPQKAQNIVESLLDIDVPAHYAEDITTPPKQGEIIVTHGQLRRGMEYPLVKMAVISDREIFGTDKRTRRRTVSKNQERIKSYADLAPGDFVVHQNHGIGQFAGIKNMMVDGATSDYLHIRFGGNDSLYVPTNQLDLLFKYTGKDGARIKLNKLGGSAWQNTKAKVRQSCAQMAEQLIELYAARQKIEGVAFSPDGEWHANFAATFPYQETDDQLVAIDEVRKDMERPHPMDRLLCGDVGYGKTEVALRAAFKAVMDGYQVAYLVPTTILANQHYQTFVNRMKDFPIKVEMLSRFRTPKQQKDTVKRAKTGEVDIIIGTHRLLQKDISFRKLGLLIIDEEQRFGVAHKELIKEMKKNVDVLTLSATPIPRTMHMGMVGIRDMSVLENPPRDRYPVSTYVLEYNGEILKEAILREVARGGQVYYLHNRVQTIDQVAARIRTFAPDLRVAIGHGKMTEHQLEDVMQQVLNREVDVLVCTTIIETGLDIPNVNTIIVEDADRMGLSQLYQLRGRVGRSNRMAYAYLLYKKDKVIHEVAEKRLRAIRDFTEFGSGFKIALRDLEIRGAGNVVGAQQHGHMDAVGYDLYCKLLSEAVTSLKGMPVKEEISTIISLTVDGYIPAQYIQGENYRIEIYKKIADVCDQQQAFEVYEEIEDRYGTVPPVVANLIDISLIRKLAGELGIEEVKQQGKTVTFTFANHAEYDFSVLGALIAQFKDQLLFSPTGKPYLTLRNVKKNMLENIKIVLQAFKRLKDDAN